jgi:hypothetical protein
MIRATMKSFMRAVICLLLASDCLHAQAQSNAHVTPEDNRSVEAVDASVHTEVDGQVHELIPAESSHRPTNPNKAKQRPETAVWPARVDASSTGNAKDDKAAPLTLGISSFRPGTQPGSSSWWHAVASTATAGVKKDDLAQGRSRPGSAPLAHPLYGSATSLFGGEKPSLEPRTTVPPVPASNQTPRLSPLSGHAGFGLAASNSAFPKIEHSGQKQPISVKRRKPHARKPATSAGTKSPLDSATAIQH